MPKIHILSGAKSPAIRSLVAMVTFTALVFSFAACTKAPEPASKALPGTAATDPRLNGSFRMDRGGWAYVHLQGEPRAIGFQHGWHLAAEIDDVLKTMSFYFERTTKRNWSFYREAAERIYWPKLDREYQEEIEGIVEGIKARRPETTYDRADLTALSGWIELAWYYIPYLDDKAAPGSADKKAPGYCSAFIATGSATKDGRIVMAHNSWVEYILGERWNAILDIVPARGNHILMDAMPGTIHSGDDFVLNGAGLLYTETTISQFKGFKEDGTPEFVRARRAAQYGATIDDFIRIMTTDNNGAYANDWLVGDVNANEIARLELGLKSHRVWRSKDGWYVGSNFPLDPKLIAEETTFDVKKKNQSVYVRRSRWEKLMGENQGAIDAEKAMAFLADHTDALTGRPGRNGNTLCGHVDADPKGVPEFSQAPYCPSGAVQAKVATAALAREYKLWARMGHPCGEDFLAADFAKKRPEWAWQLPYLRDMKGNPWTLFEAAK
jgi:hypothetical protein